MTNIFGKNGSLLVAGALAFAFASCDTDTRSNQSTVRETENMYETETNEVVDANDPARTYEGVEVDNYDYDREYSYEERDVVVDRVRNDLRRTEKSLKQVEEKMKNKSAEAKQDAKENWEEVKADLEKNRQELNTKLEDLESSTQENWEKVRNETNESLREFERDWDELKNRGIEGINNTMEDSEYVRGTAPGTGTRNGEGF